MTLFIKKTGSGYPLVLFHGWAFTHAVWQPIEAFLSSHYTLYQLDLPGFGQSDWMGWDDFKQRLFEKVPVPCAVLGWSLGGLYAMRLAIEATDRISHLVAVAASPCFVAKQHWPGVPASRFEQFYHHFKDNPAQCVKNFIAAQGEQIVFDTSHIRITQGLHPGLEYLTQWDLSTALYAYSNPAAFIFGRRDAIVPAAIMQTMQREYPNFNYHMISKAAHSPFLSHPDEFFPLIRAFI